jgi:hypothetical protein
MKNSGVWAGENGVELEIYTTRHWQHKSEN